MFYISRDLSKLNPFQLIVGDQHIFDFWCEFFYGRTGKPKGFDEVLDTLRDLAHHCPVHFFIGNHDLWTFGWLAKRTGMIVHKEPLDITLNGKRCFLAHGDGLIAKDKRYIRLRALFHNPVAQFFFRLVPPALGNYVGYNWAAASRRKHLQVPNIYHGENEEEQMVFAKQHEQTEHFDYYIFGHRHLEMHLLLPSGAQVCCIGDFCDHTQFAKMDEQGIFSFEEYLENEVS